MTDTTERAELPHKLDTLIRALPEAPFREHLRSECQAQAERIKTLEKMREEADEVEGSLRQRIASLEAERDKLRAEVERLRPNALRYEWLRSDDVAVPDGQREICVVLERLPFREDQSDEVLTGSALDTAIDRAIESAKEQQHG